MKRLILVLSMLALVACDAAGEVSIGGTPITVGGSPLVIASATPAPQAAAAAPVATATAAPKGGVTWTATSNAVKGGWLAKSRDEEINADGRRQARRIAQWVGAGPTVIDLKDLPGDRRFAVGLQHEGLDGFAEELHAYYRLTDGREFELDPRPTIQESVASSILAGFRVEAEPGREWLIRLFDFGGIN